MKFFTLIILSVKYLVRYRRRYFFLFLAISLGFGIVTILSAVKDKMYANVYNSAQDHYAGDIVAVGYDHDLSDIRHISANAKAEIYRAMEAVHLESPLVVERTHFPQEGVVYFNGNAVRLKYVIGVDWDVEASYFDSLNYQARLDIPPGENTIYLSAPVAALLNIRAGDSLTLGVNTIYGQKNTGTFIVGGIVEDATIFGYYKVYIDRVILNRLMFIADEDCSIMGIFIKDQRDVEKKRTLLQAYLSERIQTGPIVHNRDELIRESTAPHGGIRIFLITIPVYLSEVADLLDALNIVTYFLYIMMLVIMMVSALVTYRLILHERYRELGTMRTIGFYGADIRFILMLETFGLALASLAAGMILALFFHRLVTFVPFTWFPSFEIFLEDGKLGALYLPRTVAANILAVFASLFLAAAVPVYRSSREPLPDMLRGGR
ncbi:MAG: ABC transporter permease [Treponema sp.]|jgi:ABC-type lipoprotein release transport system permease subunit|nr:ABC transporter permease [Treponema sp.]